MVGLICLLILLHLAVRQPSTGDLGKVVLLKPKSECDNVVR